MGRLPRALLLPALLLAGCRTPVAEAPRPWLDAARDAGRWLESVAVHTEAGLAWPAVPAESAQPERSLYAGSPGVVLFFLELASATGDAHALDVARAGADELLQGIPERVEGEAAGLYTGLAGVGFVLGETWRATNEERYRAGCERCVRVLGISGQRRRDLPGVAWGSCNDVIAGAAGIGLFLDRAAELLESAPAHELVRLTALRLEALGEPVATGLDWPMDPEFPRRMPNFSHGTAGVAAFLARAGRTGAAVKGAEHLLAIADTTNGGLRIYHDTPDGTDLFYYGWCHGPCGLAQLFRELARVQPDAHWDEQEQACARAIESSGLPEQRLPGFWNNVSRCCGSAGVIELFVALHARTGDPKALEFARRVARDLLARATRDERGLSWIQAEHRVKPELLQAQTGLMQGAAGIGLALLHLDGAEHGRPTCIRLPDEATPAGPARTRGSPSNPSLPGPEFLSRSR